MPPPSWRFFIQSPAATWCGRHPIAAVSVHSCTRKGGASNFVPDHFVLLRAASGPLDELQAAASGMTVGKQVPGDTSRFPRGLLSTNCDQTVEDSTFIVRDSAGRFKLDGRSQAVPPHESRHSKLW